MTMPPEYSEEERMWQEAAGPVAPGAEDLAEREAGERAESEAELGYLDPEGNEAHAPGQVCARCGAMITASQDARRLPDGHWVHEVCPPGHDLSA
jgi:hypothetical protein